MADPTFSSRISAETKDKLEGLIKDSGISNKEFMDRLVANYETNLSRESMAHVKELESLRHHLARVEEIYISIVKSAKDRQEADNKRITEAEEAAQHSKAQVLDIQTQATQDIENAEEQIKTAEAEATLIRETAQKETQSMREALNRAEESREQSARLAALAEKTATEAESKANKLQEQAEQSVQYRQELEQIRRERDQLESDLAKAKEELQEEINLRDATAKSVREEFEGKLKQALERAEFEKNKAVLEVQRKALEEMRELQDGLAKCREEKTILEIELASVRQNSENTDS